MPIKYKINILSELKVNGYSTYKIRKDKLFSESTVQKFRKNEYVSLENISMACKLLKCQPGDILEYVDEQGNDY